MTIFFNKIQVHIVKLGWSQSMENRSEVNHLYHVNLNFAIYINKKYINQH